MNQPELAVESGLPSVLALARERWVETARLDLGELARELGIGRATIFRWVGSRDALMGEVIWSFHEPELHRALQQSGNRGAALMADLCRESMESVLCFEPMRQWAHRDSEYALKILSSETGVIHGRAVAFALQVLRREMADGHIAPVLALDELARLLVRIETSFLFSDLACGREPSVDSACKAVEILVAARGCQ
ncbi:QsdR family transcriptional regulator [Litorivivens sp.]|uniref:QsdR family transcriptional regulator n=1 Tax=Litorivivens sp. TaxID=2020868 RepID=UPI0035639247